MAITDVRETTLLDIWTEDGVDKVRLRRQPNWAKVRRRISAAPAGGMPDNQTRQLHDDDFI